MMRVARGGRLRRAGIGVMALALLALPALGQHHNRHDSRALAEDPRLAPGQLAPVLEGLGTNHFKVTTGSPRAQQFFDQGMLLTYGFNHQEALRSFKEAARLDPDCGMAYWGWALVLGPNLNLPMLPEVVDQAHEAMQLALARRQQVSEKERMLIEALAKRYTDDPEAERGPLDQAYADAMRLVHLRFPEDNEIATLYAASLMNLSPWNYWTRDGRPRSRTPDILEALEGVIQRDPHHEGALHYYIHAVESVDAQRGERAADLLDGLAPGAGHLVHMPSHIYMQVGRYAEAYEGNLKAVEADEGYITQCRAQGMYPLNYYPHNIHFVAWAAILEGRSAAALEASRKVAAAVPLHGEGHVWGLHQTFLSMPLYTLVRFGQWDRVLAEPQPPEQFRFWTGIWHYARGVAYANTGQLKSARRQLATLTALARDPATAENLVGFSNGGILLTIAREVLAGEVAAARGRYDEALGHLQRAVRLEDSLLYNEPPDWYYPVRHTLGDVLLQAGRPEEAEVVYWEDLRRYRDNGWSLTGLAKALRAQGRDAEADEIAARLDRSWAGADVQLASSRF